MTIAAILGIDVTAQSTTPEFVPGSLGAVTDSNGTRIYKYLKYDDASAAVDGASAEPKNSADEDVRIVCLFFFLCSCQ